MDLISFLCDALTCVRSTCDEEEFFKESPHSYILRSAVFGARVTGYEVFCGPLFAVIIMKQISALPNTDLCEGLDSKQAAADEAETRSKSCRTA